MCRTVADAAALLGAMTGVDPGDAAMQTGSGESDYTAYLDAAGLQGARIGIVRNVMWGSSPAADRVGETAIEALRGAGATVIDPVRLPNTGEYGDSEFEVLLYDFKHGLNEYLGGLGPDARVHSLAEVIEFNEANADRSMPHFGQEIMLMAEAKGPLTERAYVDALARNHRFSRAEGIDAVMDELELDALMAPTNSPAWLIDHVTGDHFAGGSSSSSAVAGYPIITVPAGFERGLPLGVSFWGRAFSEPTLIRIAYAFEQATNVRRAPGLHATLTV
jgi:amidase